MSSLESIPIHPGTLVMSSIFLRGKFTTWGAYNSEYVLFFQLPDQQIQVEPTLGFPGSPITSGSNISSAPRSECATISIPLKERSWCNGPKPPDGCHRLRKRWTPRRRGRDTTTRNGWVNGGENFVNIFHNLMSCSVWSCRKWCFCPSCVGVIHQLAWDMPDRTHGFGKQQQNLLTPKHWRKHRNETQEDFGVFFRLPKGREPRQSINKDQISQDITGG